MTEPQQTFELADFIIWVGDRLIAHPDLPRDQVWFGGTVPDGVQLPYVEYSLETGPDTRANEGRTIMAAPIVNCFARGYPKQIVALDRMAKALNKQLAAVGAHETETLCIRGSHRLYAYLLPDNVKQLADQPSGGGNGGIVMKYLIMGGKFQFHIHPRPGP